MNRPDSDKTLKQPEEVRMSKPDKIPNGILDEEPIEEWQITKAGGTL